MGYLKLVSLLMFFTSTLLSNSILGVGYSYSSDQAKKNSLADLSNNISVEVKSEFKTSKKKLEDNYSKSNESLLELSSNLPLLGVDFKEFVGSKLVKSTATLSSKSALKVYKLELNRLASNIKTNKRFLKNSNNQSEKYNILNQLLKDIESFNKHKIVATILNGSNLPKIDITKSQVELQLQKISSKAPNIDIAVNKLIQNIDKKNIYISAIKPSGSYEVTQFAKIVKNSISKKLDNVYKSDDAEYFLKGDYEILKDSLFITLNLYDLNNKIVYTNTATLAPSAYKNTKYKPTTKDFDTAMNSSMIGGANLKVKIGFKGYNRANGIDLNNGDKVDLVVKTNRDICYFLQGSTLSKNKKYSYLLPIGSDNSQFTNKITGDDVNIFKPLFTTYVGKPFGREVLTIFAKELNKKGECEIKIPNCRYDNNIQLCLLSDKPTIGLISTRALFMPQQRRNEKEIKLEVAESSIDFTTSN